MGTVLELGCGIMAKWKITVPKDLEVDKSGYTIDGKKYVRVTRSLGVISKPGLLTWFQKVGKSKADSIMKNRQILGTKVHSLFEKMVKGETIYTETYNQEVQLDVRLFKNFMEKCIVGYDSLEQRLWSTTLGYAGTADFIGTYKSNPDFLVRGWEPKFKKGALVIGDWKTSRDIYDEYWLQLAAYCWAFYELTGIKVAGAFIAQFRGGKIRVKEKTWDELMEDLEVYKSVLVLYRWKYKL